MADQTTNIEQPTGAISVSTNGNGNGRTRVTLVRGLLVMLGIVIVGLVATGLSVLYWKPEQDITKEVVSGLLTLATVLSSGLVGMAKGSSS